LRLCAGGFLVVGAVWHPNSLLSVLVKDTRHLIFYTLESVGEALGEQPHLTGGSKTKPGGKRVAHSNSKSKRDQGGSGVISKPSSMKRNKSFQVSKTM
jgi:hypothetical protein